MDGLDRIALVTGASSGIGWHLSEELAARGYSMVAGSNQAVALPTVFFDITRGHCGLN